MSMFPIASATLTNSSTNIFTFSSIPQTFTHLQIRCSFNPNSTSAGDYQNALTINGDSYPNTNYSFHFLAGNGSSATSGGYASQWSIPIGDYGNYGSIVTVPNASTYCNFITDILDYTNTNKNKTVRSISGVDVNGVGGQAIMFSGAKIASSPLSAVTSLSMFASGTGHNWSAGTRFDLYGIQTSNATGA